MIIGNVLSFAVKMELDTNYGEEWLMGKFCFLLKGKSIGNYELGTSLRDVLFQLEQISFDNGKRNNEKLFKIDKDTLFEMFDKIFYGKDTSEYFELAKEENWYRYNIKMAVDIFDGWKLYLIESEEKSRFIIGEYNEIKEKYIVYEEFIKIKEFDAVINNTCKDLKHLYEKELV